MSQYVKGFASGAGGGAMAGAPFGPVGMGIGAIGGGLLGLWGAHENENNRDTLNRAYDDAIAASQQHGRQMNQYYGAGNQYAQGFLSPLDNLYQKWYGQNPNPNANKPFPTFDSMFPPGQGGR